MVNELRRLVGWFLGALFLFGLLVVNQAKAQVLDRQWQEPRLLSNPGVVNTSPAEMVADPYGRLHVFWREVDPDDGVHTIQYAVFDGKVWSEAVDIFAAPPRQDIESLAAAIDGEGTIHLVWNEGNNGPVYYSRAPATDALTARAWSERIFLEDVAAYRLQLQVDAAGVLHLVYINFYGNEPGIYYTRSQDGGENWQASYWLDPDIPLREAPSVMNFKMDEAGGLHVLWYYLNLDTVEGLGDWVRYTRSLDGGETWDIPTTIDLPDESPDELRLPYPGLAVVGDTVHVIWAGTSGTQREYRFSTDRGATWSETERVFGGLAGQALGDGLAADAAGRLHYFGQIRWPQGLYHATWEQETGWSAAEMIYLIAGDAFEGRNGRYHVHNIRAAALNGNQLVVTFTDEAIGPLYAMTTTLEDVTAVPPKPTPTLPRPTPSPTPETVPVTPTPTRRPFAQDTAVAPAEPITFSDSLWLGVLPAAVLLLAVLVLRLRRS